MHQGNDSRVGMDALKFSSVSAMLCFIAVPKVEYAMPYRGRAKYQQSQRQWRLR